MRLATPHELPWIFAARIPVGTAPAVEPGEDDGDDDERGREDEERVPPERRAA